VARELGHTLPEFLCELLGGRDLLARLGQAIPIATIDAEGRPHPALLSYGEVVAVDPRRLRLAVARASRTSGNLRRNGKLTLSLFGPDTAYYIKAAARIEQDPMEGFGHLCRVEAAVESVLADRAQEGPESGAHVTGGITFDPGRPGEEVVRGWRAVLDGLRGEA
jgi:hypothetical protein